MFCPICLKCEATNWDHDHSTDIIRGKLCRRCNTAIGSLDEDFETLQRAIAYLQRAPGDLKYAEIKREYMRLAMQKWRATHRELDRERKRQAYANDPERMREYSRRWKKNDATGEKARRAYENHKRWVAEHPDRIEEYNQRRREKQHADRLEQYKEKYRRMMADPERKARYLAQRQIASERRRAKKETLEQTQQGGA